MIEGEGSVSCFSKQYYIMPKYDNYDTTTTTNNNKNNGLICL